jgi:molecular chaperone GrpE (heat shock protein)
LNKLDRLFSLYRDAQVDPVKEQEFKEEYSKLQALIEDGEKYKKLMKNNGNNIIGYSVKEIDRLESQIQQLTNEKKQLEEERDHYAYDCKRIRERYEKQLEQYKAIVDEIKNQKDRYEKLIQVKDEDISPHMVSVHSAWVGTYDVLDQILEKHGVK